MMSLSLKENRDDFKIKICLREHVQRSGANLVSMKRTCMHACVRVCTSTTGMAFIVVHMQKGLS